VQELLADHEASVLLVEDDADTERLVLRALRRAGAENVVVARNGEEALSTVANGAQPDLVLLDAKLPGLDGYEVLRQMRAEGTAQKSPIVVFSSEDEDAAQVRAVAMGASEYAVKPVDYQDLMDAVAAIVNRWLPKDLVTA